MNRARTSAFRLLVPLLAVVLPALTPVISAADSPERFLTPPADDGPPVVKVSFVLQEIDGMDDEAETFSFNGVLQLAWKDSRQSFDAAQAGVPEKIYQGSHQFDGLPPAWYPQLFLVNENGQFETSAITLRIRPDGTSVLTSAINASASARLSMRRYPFDSQTLRAVFQIPGFRFDEVTFEAEKSSFDAGIRIPQWSVRGITISTAATSGSPGFAVEVSVKRDPIFTLRLVALPLALIVMLSWSVFWMERSSLGDRISVSFVGILTAVAYQIVVGDLLPHVSYITLIHAFLNLSFFMMCATVVINLVVGACDKNGKTELGDLIDRRCRWIFPLVYLGLLPVIFLIAFHFLP